MTTSGSGRSPASFRDPSGFVFERGGDLLRQVNRSYAADYDRLVGSGLYADLVAAGWMVPHEEADEPPCAPDEAYRVLRLERLPFISYPYEWCFGQYRAAALRTLDIQGRALDAGMSLKDAGAYNIQFRGGRPALIDTLSFEAYRDGAPWVAYRQFCQHFLAPLALMSRADVDLVLMMRTHIDGIPLGIASRLLDWRSCLSPGLLVHVHLHARLQRGGDGGEGEARRGRFRLSAMRDLVASLRSTVEGLRWSPSDRGWAGYADDNSYTADAREFKHRFVAECLDHIRPAVAWDLGANTGEYSRLASGRGIATIALDFDPSCVERNYRDAMRRGDARLLPLRMDLANPSPALGWRHRERLSLLDRGPADVVLALALVHHLALANNLPLPLVAEFLAQAGRWLVVEFVPKDDPQARRLLAGRDDIFDGYHRGGFEAAARRHFAIERAEPVPDGDRVLYLMRREGEP